MLPNHFGLLMSLQPKLISLFYNILQYHLYRRGLVFSNIWGFLVITFLFLIFRRWKFAWLDLLGSYFEKWSRFVHTTTLTWISTTWSPSKKRCCSPSWTNSDSGHTHYWPSIQSNASGNGPKWFLVPKYLGFDTKIKSVGCLEVELLHDEEVHHLFQGEWPCCGYPC